MGEFNKRITRAKKTFESLPDWAKNSAVFMGGPRIRQSKISKAVQLHISNFTDPAQILTPLYYPGEPRSRLAIFPSKEEAERFHGEHFSPSTTKE